MVTTGVGGFTASWRHIVETLKAKAAERSWPVDPASIIEGNWRGDTAITPPAILVYMIPGKLFDVQSAHPHVATLSVFAVVPDTGDVAETTGNAVSLGWKIERVLSRVGLTIRWGRDRVTLDTVADGFAATHVQCEVWYLER